MSACEPPAMLEEFLPENGAVVDFGGALSPRLGPRRLEDFFFFFCEHQRDVDAGGVTVCHVWTAGALRNDCL